MKKILVIIFIMLNITAIISCSEKNNNEENGIPLDVSLIQLIANPADYHGKKIRISGVAEIGHSGVTVYFDKDGWYYLGREKLWVSIESKTIEDENAVYLEDTLWYYINDEWISYEEAQEYNGKYVIIEGIFDMYMTGNREMHLGGINNVTRFEDVSYYNRDMDMYIYGGEYIGNVEDWAEENIK